MGVYAGDALLSGVGPPVTMRMAILTWLICDIDDVPEHYVIKATGPIADQPLFEKAFAFPPVPQGTDSKKAHLRADIQLQGLRVEGDGIIAVYIQTERETIRAGQLAIKFVDAQPAESSIISSNETQPPSLQSRDGDPKKEKKRAPSRPSRPPASPKRPR